MLERPILLLFRPTANMYFTLLLDLTILAFLDWQNSGTGLRVLGRVPELWGRYPRVLGYF